jgi:hypothetical protein
MARGSGSWVRQNQGATEPSPWENRGNRGRRSLMGDKGKKDKDKDQKQKSKQDEQEAKKKQDKQPKRVTK